jgi:hypothetical protein
VIGGLAERQEKNVVEFTDTASDMADIIRVFIGTRADGKPAWQGFEQATGIHPQQFLNFCSVMVSRLAKLRRLVDRMDDPDFKPAQRRGAQRAISRFTDAFLPANFATNWTNHVAGHIREEDAEAFEWLSIVARRHEPLRKLTEDDRAALIARIDEAIGSLNADIEIPEWAKLPLGDGLSQLRFVLQHLSFLGCDTAISALVSVHRDAQAAEAAMFGDVTAKGDKQARSKGLMDVLGVIALAVTLFNAPDQVATAFERYKGWMLDYISKDHSVPKLTRQLYLEAPRPSAPAQDADNEPGLSALKPKEPGQIDESSEP